MVRRATAKNKRRKEKNKMIIFRFTELMEGEKEWQIEASATRDSNEEKNNKGITFPGRTEENPAIMLYWPPAESSHDTVHDFEKGVPQSGCVSIWVGGDRKVGKTSVLSSFLLSGKIIAPKWTGSFSGGCFFAEALTSIPSQAGVSQIPVRYHREAVLGSGDMWVKLRPQSMRAAAPTVIILLFSIASHISFAAVADYLAEYAATCPKIPVLLVGNKTDLRAVREELSGIPADQQKIVETRSQLHYRIIKEEIEVCKGKKELVTREEIDKLLKGRKQQRIGYMECSLKDPASIVRVFSFALQHSVSPDVLLNKKGKCFLM